MDFDEAADDRQAEAGAVGRCWSPLPRLLGTIEAIPNMGKVSRLDPVTAIANA